MDPLLITITYQHEVKGLELDHEIVELLKDNPSQHPTNAAKHTVLQRLKEVVAERYAQQIQQYINDHVKELD